MYIGMNRLRIPPENEDAFRDRWLGREVHLHTVPGFISFQLLAGPRSDECILYASHTVWQSHAAFENWTRSEEFRAAHASAGTKKPLMIGPPVFEGFEVVQNIIARMPDTEG